MKKQNLKIGVLLLAALAGCTGPSYKPVLKPYQLDAKDFQFASGLRILFQEDHSEPTVYVTNVVGVGSTAEPPGKEGMAHLIEHLNFKARHGNKPEVWDEIRQLGASNFNANTTQDRTLYLTPAPKEALIPLLEIESHRLIDAIEGVTEDELKSEREVVRNELRQSYENGGGRPYLLADEMLYPATHPYHRSVIGTHESLDNITLADVRAFVDKWYRPQNSTIVVTGDFDRNEAGAFIAKTFPLQTLIPPGSPAGTKPTMVAPKPRLVGAGDEPPPPADKSIRHVSGPVATTQVILAWSMPGSFRPNQALMQVTAQTMGGAVGSTLYPDDNRGDEKVAGVDCGAQPQPLATTAYCVIDVIEGQDPDAIAQKALNGLVQMWASDAGDIDVGDAEVIHIEGGQRHLFAAARSQFESELFRESASLSRAEQIAEDMHYTAKPDYFTQAIESVSKINAFDARELASKYLTRERAVIVVVNPYDKKEKPTNGVASDSGSSWAGAILKEDSRSIVDYGTITNDKIAALGKAPDLSKVKEITLDNGLHVRIAKHGAAPFVSVALYTHGGLNTTTPPNLSELVFPTFTAQDPGKFAGSWFGGPSGDSGLIGIEAPSGNLAAALDDIYQRVSTTKSAWSRRRFEQREKVMKQRLKTQENRPTIWARRALFNLLIPGSPLGAPMDWKALEKLEGSDYEAWLKADLAPKNAELEVVGDVDLAEAEKLVRDTWSNWHLKDPGAPLPGYKPVDVLPARQIALLDDQEATQSEVRVGCHLKKRSLETDSAKDALDAMLSQDLFIAIRKRAGASYGVYAQSFTLGDTSLMVVAGAIQNDKAIPGLRTILDRMAELKDGKIDKLKLVETKWGLAGKTHTEDQSNDDMLSTLLGVTGAGRTLDTLSTYPRRLADVSTKQISEVLEPCVGHEVITVTGPAKMLRPGLESLKIPIEDVDWKKGSDSTTKVDSKASNP